MADELAELQKEFRASVLASLAELKQGQRQREQELVLLKTDRITRKDIEDIEERINALEKTKTQLITAFILIQAVIVLLWKGLEFWKA